MKAFVIAKYTFLEVVKSKIMINTVILGIGIAIVSYLSTGLTYGVPEKVSLDVGLGLLSLSLDGIAIFIGVNIVAKEIETRTIYVLLSKELSRSSYFSGRMMGMSWVLLLDFMILSTIITVIVSLLGGDTSGLYLYSLFFILLESFWLLIIVVLFSLVTNVVMSVVYSIAIYFVGHALSETLSLINRWENEFTLKLLTFSSYFLPNFSKLNIKDFLLYHQSLPSSYLINCFIYFLSYASALYLLSLYLFNKKELD